MLVSGPAPVNARTRGTYWPYRIWRAGWLDSRRRGALASFRHARPRGSPGSVPKERHVPTPLRVVDQPHLDPAAVGRIRDLGFPRRAPFSALPLPSSCRAGQSRRDAAEVLAPGAREAGAQHDAQLQPDVVRVLPAPAHGTFRAARPG